MVWLIMTEWCGVLTSVKRCERNRRAYMLRCMTTVAIRCAQRLTCAPWSTQEECSNAKDSPPHAPPPRGAKRVGFEHTRATVLPVHLHLKYHNIYPNWLPPTHTGRSAAKAHTHNAKTAKHTRANISWGRYNPKNPTSSRYHATTHARATALHVSSCHPVFSWDDPNVCVRTRATVEAVNIECSPKESTIETLR